MANKKNSPKHLSPKPPLFKNRYRIPSARLQTWDYGSNGAYFITICCGDRRHHFGKIENGQMHLSDVGLLAEQFWYTIPEHFPF